VIDCDRRRGDPAGAFLEHHAPTHRTSVATSPPLPAGAVSTVPPASGERDTHTDWSPFDWRARPRSAFAADVSLGPFGYGLRMALCQRRCKSASNRVSTSGATCEYTSTTRFGR